MNDENLIQTKSYTFALRIIKAYQYLQTETYENVLSKQLLKAGTSVGANVEEAIGAQSKKDFIAKLSISLKEAREAHYWLRLLRDSNYLTSKQADSLLEDCTQLLKILTAILKTSKRSL